MAATATQLLATRDHGFESVVTRYSPILYRVALRCLRNPQDAEDAVQDALLSAYKHIAQFEGRSQLSTWLTRIVANSAGMQLRRRPRQEPLSLEQGHDQGDFALIDQLVDAGPSPETACEQLELDAAIQQALRKLSPRLRSAFLLRELQGLSTRETALALGISQNTLKSRISRARAALTPLLRKTLSTRKQSGEFPARARPSGIRSRHSLQALRASNIRS